MYLEDACTIKRTDDGKFVLSVAPPRKKEKEGKSGLAEPMHMEDPKTYVANDIEELVGLIREYLPGKTKEKDKFKRGFESKK